MTLLGTLFALFFVAPVLLLWQAYCASILWYWFALPLGAPPVGTVAMWGLLVLVGAIKMGTVSWEDLEERSTREKLAKLGCAVAWGLVGPPLQLSVGWIVRALS